MAGEPSGTFETARNLFFTAQGLTLVGLGAALFFFFRARDTQKGFKKREHAEFQPSAKQLDSFWNKPFLKKTTLALPGIRLEGAPHEILGVPPHATAAQIQKAYRDLMKRYHPDKVGPIGSPEWTQAQKIAEVINRAKTELLKSAQSESSNRSGR